jgi:Leucine-rich repeat (LRR) protein
MRLLSDEDSCVKSLLLFLVMVLLLNYSALAKTVNLPSEIISTTGSQTTSVTTAISTVDSTALVALYVTTDGPHWTQNKNWLKGPVNTWYGILTEGTSVVQILLGSNNLTGSIPAQIGQLSNLISLDLDDNKLTGVIPPQIGSLSKLIILNLGTNQLSGNIPTEIGKLSNLGLLWLSSNQLYGSIPAEIWQLKNLKKLNLNLNKLNGSIPSNIGYLTNLQELTLSFDSLSGSIPKEIGRLKNLERLNLCGNRLSGVIPDSIGKLTNLIDLNLAVNQLTNSITNQIGQLTKLTKLYLNSNLLSGSIPSDIGKLTLLTNVYLSDNRLSGALPTQMGKLINLTDLQLQKNQLTGAVPAEFKDLNKLENLQLANNYLDELPALSPIYTLLSCSNNNFTFEDFERNLDLIDKDGLTFTYLQQNPFGREIDTTINEGGHFILSIPCGGVYNHYTWYKDGIQLTTALDSAYISFSKIQLTDAGTYYSKVKNDSVPGLILTSRTFHLSIVESCLKADSLNLVAFYHATGGDNWINRDNWLSGPVKSWWGITTDSCYVTKIDMVTDELNQIGNNLTGTIPSEIGNFSHLTQLRLSFNHLSGTIPTSIGNLSNLLSLNLDWNKLTGEIPKEIGQLTMIQSIGLGNDSLSGKIPDELFNLSHLKRLELWENELTGTLSSDVGKLVNLEYLSINSNKLSGEIPVELGNLTNLTWLDLGDNQFSGTIPLALMNLNKLTGLHMYNNLLSGSIPVKIGQLTSLSNIGLNGNSLTGTIPDTLFNLPDLEYISLSDNKLTGSLPERDIFLPDIKDIRFENNLIDDLPITRCNSILLCSGNKLTFEDLERNLDLIDKPDIEFDYSPQLSFGREFDTTTYEGNQFILNISCGGKYNHYKWIKDGKDYNNSLDSSTLTFPKIKLSDAGKYYLSVTNDSVPGLTLTSDSVTVQVISKSPECLDIRAYIDGLSNLIISSDSIFWHHFTGAAPGRNGGNSYPTYINGKDWYPVWPDIPDGENRQECLSSVFTNSDLKLPAFQQKVNLQVISGKESVSIAQQPDKTNNYTLNLQFEDSSSPGASWFEIMVCWDTIAIPESPILVSPADKETELDTILTFSWKRCPMADSYTIQLSTTPDFTDLVANYSGITDTTIGIADLAEGTTYYWRVNATNIMGTSPWSEVWEFTTKSINKELIPVNLIIVNGSQEPYFTISGIELYPDNHLRIFTKWGSRIYEKLGYDNSLDMSGYPEGTYYYILTYFSGGEQKQMKNFVDVIKK